MVYGIVRLINFAHGDVFMVGAFVSYFAISRCQPAHLAAGVVVPGLSRWPVASWSARLPCIVLAMVTLRLAGGRDRAHRLQAAARRAAHLGPHHGHRRLVLSGILRGACHLCSRPTSSPTSALSRRHLVHQGRHSPPGAGQQRAGRQHYFLQHLHHHRAYLAASCWLLLQVHRAPDQDRQGHARRRLRQSRPRA